MNKSETIVKITAALLEAQKAIEPVSKSADNPFFHSKYADLNAVIDACKDVLNKQGIVVMQPLNRDSVETIFIHTSGEWVSGETMIVSKDASNPQSYGSAVSYARRYGLMSMMLMKAEDDDGNSATESKPKAEPAKEEAKTGVRLITSKQLNYLSQLMALKGVTNEELSEKYKVTDLTKLDSVQASSAIESLI